MEPRRKLRPDQGRFDFRKGIGGFPGWRGVFREGDPASIPLNSLWTLINGRFKGGSIRPRFGITEHNSTAIQASDACIGWIDDFQVSAPNKLWIGMDGCPGISTGTGFSLVNLDSEQSPNFQRSVYYNGAVTRVVLATYGSQLHVAVDDELRVIELLLQPYGIENLSVSGSAQDLPLVQLSTGTIRCMAEFDGTLFLGVDDGAGNSFIATWDGVTLLEDDLTGIDAPQCMAIHHVPDGGDALFVGIAGELRYRDTDGNWTTAATATDFDPNEMLPYKDSLYVANADGDQWEWDNSSLASANSPTGATACRAIEVADGYLFYGYETASAALIGRFDGSSWADTHKNLTTQTAGTTTVRTLREHRGYLVAGGLVSGSGRIFVGDIDDTTGTYAVVVPNVSNSGDFNFMVVG